MKKNLKFGVKMLFSLFIFYNLIYIGANAANNNPPNINAEAAILIDANTGDVLYSKKGEDKHFPASTTKVLTALITLEHTNLNDVVTIGPNPPFAKGSSIGLKEGEKFTVETLLTGLLLESGNDCAEALAEHVGGSIDNFAKMMNEKAKELGCTNSNFVNPSGLPDDNHVTTAHDLALIMQAALKNNDFIRISRLVSVELPASNLDGQKRWANNHNYLINPNSKYFYKYALAGKSGYTDVARHTFIISGEKDGQRLIAVFLKAEDKNKNYEDMAKLLDYGFNNFENIKLYSKGQEIENVKIGKDTNIPLLIDRDVFATIKRDEANSVKPTINYDLPKNIDKMTISKGEDLTKGTILFNGNEIEQVNLVSGGSREYSSKVAITEFLQRNSILVIGITILFIICILILIRIHIVRKRRKRLAFKRRWQHLNNRKRY
ncbi:MAG: D-alanyl-D-alanine carboxypeptidase [Clostridium baratii]|uniref:serine-type D-Ala-D-Ala carboxypeptidase n=1 Tax=Clostridium baratii str. Sullivan TaxID=1415775 RepID=A0A0A7FRL3_9CLOT|nr:D-alanyl-D-alanine carboxypeptidase family protein [Clostridium baratii]AIY82259.1 D-alanyl-D-alanine carboxypeptidase family protein [Clostridium baratii str. Sullivan]MBS6005482.1 D-alanyl-D-alanine carboxypeptidase [Clostridium baratii]MDU4910039.1 D-alanyl-D-alanine carboxypeptidase family protein [Clostridium baratii]